MAVAPVSTALTLPREAPTIDWAAVGRGRWAPASVADAEWDRWAAESIRTEVMPWAPALAAPHLAFLSAEAQMPDLVTLSLVGALPQLPLDTRSCRTGRRGPPPGTPESTTGYASPVAFGHGTSGRSLPVHRGTAASWVREAVTHARQFQQMRRTAAGHGLGPD